MPLNEKSLLAQIESRANSLQQLRHKQEQQDLPAAIQQYLQTSRAGWLSLEELARARQAAAMPVEELDQCRRIEYLPAIPASYIVVATDGSAIPPDRHGGLAFCQVVNIGEVVLGYGERHLAHIDSDTRFYLLGADHEAEALAPAPKNRKNQESRDEGEVGDADFEIGGEGLSNQSLLLDTQMSVDELETSLRLTGEYWATLALRDGPLTLWSSSILNSSAGRALTRRYLDLLERFSERGTPIVGYTSGTRSDVVITALRVMTGDPLAYRGLTDAQLFGAILEVGQCSPAFRHSARHPKDSALTEQIRFMYLKTEDELVRLEFPVAFLGTEQLEMALGLVWQQIKLGQGYPAALMEAHESAVLRQADRELLRAVLESYGLVGHESQKGLSKRLRNV